MNNVPVLFTTYNRLDFTKISLPKLIESNCGTIFVIDNASTDGTAKYLRGLKSKKLVVVLNDENTGVAGAMNIFIKMNTNNNYLAKVDNDTIVKKDWLDILLKKVVDKNIDIIQAKHPILVKTHATGSFDEWMKKLEQDKDDNSIYYSKFVGGSGIVFNRKIITEDIPTVEWKLAGWREFQRKHTSSKKAFCTETVIKLLDMNEGGGANYIKYPDYYKETRRA
jgi:GT2 family glycosyltransferase